jgi:outer membrane protein insertion porin family
MISFFTKNRRKYYFLYLLLLCTVIPGQLSAQEPDYDNMPVINYANPREYEIAEVTISGVEFLQPEVLISLSGLAVGDIITIPGDDIKKVIDKFWSQGLFSDVKITATKIEEGKIYLDIYLRERPRLTRFEMDGISKSDIEDLTKKINLRNGVQVTQDLLNNAERIIKDHFIEKGFYNAKVEIIQKQDTSAGNGVSLRLNVYKNKRVRIEDIEYVGNEVYPEQRLRRVLKKTKEVNINFFKPSKLVQNLYKEDKQKLIDFYNENGYRDAKILRDSIYIVSEDRVKLKIFMDEGDKYYFRNITWVGNTIYPSEILGHFSLMKMLSVHYTLIMDIFFIPVILLR